MKLSFFTVLTSSLLAGHSLQATDVLSSHQDSNRHTSSHCNPSYYGSSPKDFSDPHPGQEVTLHSVQISAEEYPLDMSHLWEGMSRNPLTQEEKEQLFHNLSQQPHFQVPLLSSSELNDYNTKLTQVLNFYTKNMGLIRQAVNEISVDILRRNNNLRPQAKYIPDLQRALSEQIVICEDLMKTPFGEHSTMILSHLIDALIDNFRCETEISKLNNELQPRIISNLKLLKQNEAASKSENPKYYEDLLKKFKKSLEAKKVIFLHQPQ